MVRYLIGFFGMLALCFTAQTLGLRAVGGKTAKSESNYFSSLARVQTASAEKPRVLMLGSSLTGRMSDRAAAVDGFVNIGCDGGSAAITLRAIDRGEIDPASTVVVEANTLAYDLDGRGSQMSSAICGDWFQLGREVPNLGATARPTAFVYSAMMKVKEGDPAPVEKPLPVASKPGAYHGPAPADLTEPEQALVDEMAGIIGRLEERGSRVVLVLLPPGEIEGSSELRVARGLAWASGAEWWDLNDGLPADRVHFTDGRHMEAESAAETMATLSGELLK
ncbi:hypothetical protein [Haloferula sargassicola]|uniref:SGNH hydrolase-type esterase domain-containing protein n=1 Tax=Haloferula sargassicola TaxID=490096 RepID=A0ABP9UK05_9BACT